MKALIAAAGLTLLPMLGHAAEIKVLSVIPLKTSMEELGPLFERTGHKLVVEYDGSSQLKRRLEAGEAFDIALIYPELIDALVKQGKLAKGTSTAIARVLIAVAVKKGAPKPDIGTVDAFRHTLLDAKSIAHSREGASGVYFMGLLDRLGIAAQTKPKLIGSPAGPGGLVSPVVKGEAEMVVGTMSAIMEPGVTLVGAIPNELQNWTSFPAGVATASQDPGAAQALIRFLTAPGAVAAIQAKGMEPLGR